MESKQGVKVTVGARVPTMVTVLLVAGLLLTQITNDELQMTNTWSPLTGL